MKKLMITTILLSLFAVCAAAQSNEFTYQGRLLDNSLPPTANYDFEFSLWDAIANGNQQGTTQTVTGVAVANGIFTVKLNFGANFPGAARFLQIAVRPAGGPSYTTLAPRQPITSSPYSIKSSSSTSSDGLSVACNLCVTDAHILSIDGAKVTGTVTNATNAVNAATATSATTAGNVTGVVAIANGGTGSDTKNFVDLTTNQAIGGSKSFSNTIDGSAAKQAVNTSNSTTPSVANLTLLALNYSSFTTLTDLSGGVEGQCVVLVTLNGNARVLNTGSFRLSKDWMALGNDTLTVCRSNASGLPLWYERARSQPPIFQYLLSVSRDGNGTGTVLSSPGGISCGSSCLASFNSGQIVSLTPVAAEFSTFAGWSGACTGTGTCTLTMDSLRSVSATFIKPIYTMTTSRSGPGSIISSPSSIYCGLACSAQFDSGTLLTLTPVPDPGAAFGNWSGACTGTNPTCNIVMDGNKSATANFGYLFTVSRTGGGTVTSVPTGINCGSDCNEVFTSGTVVTLVASANPGGTFMGWSGDCVGAASTCVVTMNMARNVDALFTP